MKKFTQSLIFIVMLGTAAAFAQGGPAPADDLPRIAVYVTGSVPENERKALGTRMLATLVNSGRYKGIERSNAFVAEIEREQLKQRSGAIDDNQITELGKQFGVRYVCIADITPAFGTFQVSARIVDVETAEVAFIGESYSNLRSADDLKQVSNEVVSTMFGGTQPPQPVAAQPVQPQEPAQPQQPEAAQAPAQPQPAATAAPAPVAQAPAAAPAPPPKPPKPPKPKRTIAEGIASPKEKSHAPMPPKERDPNAIKYGARLGLNVGKYLDGYDGEYNIGPGAGAALSVVIPLPVERLAISVEVGLFYRELFNFTHYDAEAAADVWMSMFDIVLSVPIMLRYEPIEDVPLYIVGGFQIDASAMNEYKRSVPGLADIQEPRGERAPAEVGIAIGGGYMVTPHIGVDLRGTASLTPLFTPEDKDAFGMLLQFGAGITVLF